MFTSNVQETEQDRIVLYEVSPDALELILNFMYSGLIDIGPENAQDIFMASNLFELLDVVDCCVEYMTGQLHVSNCIEMFNFAQYHTCKKLESACKNFILQNVTVVANTTEFLQIDAVTMENFLESDDINVTTEDFMFEVIENWVKHDLETRKIFFPRLFHNVRLPLVSDEYLNAKIVNSIFIKDNSFCLSIIDAFLRSKYNNEAGLSIDSCTLGSESKIRQRSGMLCRDLIIFSGGSFGEKDRAFTAYDPVSMKNYYGLKHHPTFDLKYRIDFYQLITLNKNEVYFIGGIFHDKYRFSEYGEALRNCYKYEQRISSWMACESLIIPRCAFSACSSENFIFVSGGKSIYPTGNPLDSFEVYDSNLCYWRMLEPMPLKLYHHASVAVNGGVYIFGGKDIVDEISDIVMRFDIKTEKWYTINTKLINPRFEHSAIAINNDVYLVGGMTLSSYAVTVQIFNIENNRWRYGKDFPDERKATAVTRFGNKIYVCGGIRQFYRRNKPTRTAESKDLYSYDSVTDSWLKISRMVQYASSVACVYANINTSFLTDSGYVSTGGEG
jgi:hypothetical protein